MLPALLLPVLLLLAEAPAPGDVPPWGYFVGSLVVLALMLGVAEKVVALFNRPRKDRAVTWGEHEDLVSHVEACANRNELTELRTYTHTNVHELRGQLNALALRLEALPHLIGEAQASRFDRMTTEMHRLALICERFETFMSRDRGPGYPMGKDKGEAT